VGGNACYTAHYKEMRCETGAKRSQQQVLTGEDQDNDPKLPTVPADIIQIRSGLHPARSVGTCHVPRAELPVFPEFHFS
jgi:hypothetical protein